MEEQLNVTVLQEKRPVTYKSLARQHAIHVNTAKQALWDYAQNTPNVHAIYCIAGRLVVDSNTSRDTIRLVKEHDLEETKKQFREVRGIHVYSVIPYDPKDLTVLVTVNKDIPFLSVQDRISCGVLKCTQALSAKPSTQKRTQPDTALTQRASSSKPSASSKAADSTPAPVAAAPAKKPTTTPSKRKGTLSFEKHATKSSSPARSSSSSSPTPPPPPAAAVKTLEKQPTPEPKKPSLTAEDIFSEDEDMAESDPMRDQPIFDPMETDEPAGEEEQEQQPEEKGSEPEADEEEQVQEQAPKKPLAGQKRRRKVTKKRHYTNERGFLVTEDVEEYETVDEDEGEDRPPAPSSSAPQRSTTERNQSKPSSTPTPAPKKSGAKKAQGEQRNLFSFWAKK